MGIQFKNSIVHGTVESGFEKVQYVFTNNFKQGKEYGAAFAAYKDGRKIVDLWGGYRDVRTRSLWDKDTMMLVFSTTKGLAGLTMAVAHLRGLFEYDEKVSFYWPEFAQNGKENIKVWQLLSHQAGLPTFDEPVNIDTLMNTKKMADIMARQKPYWKPGAKHGYHSTTLGWYEGELIRRIDPKGRTLGQFFADEIARPLDLDFYIGLPDSVPDSHIANIHAPLWRFKMLFNMDKLPKNFVKRMLFQPKSLTARAISIPNIGNLHIFNTRRLRSMEIPAGNLIKVILLRFFLNFYKKLLLVFENLSKNNSI